MKFNESIWNDITNNNEAEFIYKLLSIDCIPPINIGKQKNGNKFLLLELPLNFQKQFLDKKSKLLSLKYYSKEKLILIILNDLNYSDIFDDFIFSYYLRVKEVENVNEYSQILIDQFNNWDKLK